MTENNKSLQPTLDERFIMTIKGKEFVLYAGLLDLAHQKGLKGISVEALQYPTKENGMEGICKAIIESKDGEEYIEIGDANPKNVNSFIVEHVLRMAATRAKARALRDFTNIGITCLEELGDLNDVIGDENPKPKTRSKAAKKTTAASSKSDKVKSDQKPAATEKKPETKKSDASQSDQPKMSKAQKTAIINLSKRRGIAEKDLESMAEDAYGTSLESLTSKDAAQFIRSLQQAA